MLAGWCSRFFCRLLHTAFYALLNLRGSLLRVAPPIEAHRHTCDDRHEVIDQVDAGIAISVPPPRAWRPGRSRHPPRGTASTPPSPHAVFPRHLVPLHA